MHQFIYLFVLVASAMIFNARCSSTNVIMDGITALTDKMRDKVFVWCVMKTKEVIKKINKNKITLHNIRLSYQTISHSTRENNITDKWNLIKQTSEKKIAVFVWSINSTLIFNAKKNEKREKSGILYFWNSLYANSH